MNSAVSFLINSNGPLIYIYCQSYKHYSIKSETAFALFCSHCSMKAQSTGELFRALLYYKIIKTIHLKVWQATDVNRIIWRAGDNGGKWEHRKKGKVARRNQGFQEPIPLLNIILVAWGDLCWSRSDRHVGVLLLWWAHTHTQKDPAGRRMLLGVIIHLTLKTHTDVQTQMYCRRTHMPSCSYKCRHTHIHLKEATISLSPSLFPPKATPGVIYGCFCRHQWKTSRLLSVSQELQRREKSLPYMSGSYGFMCEDA